VVFGVPASSSQALIGSIVEWAWPNSLTTHGVFGGGRQLDQSLRSRPVPAISPMVGFGAALVLLAHEALIDDPAYRPP